MPATTVTTEFDRQIDQLIELGYPTLAGCTAESFRAELEPLRPSLPSASTMDGEDHIPFVVVVNAVPPAAAATLMTLNGRSAELMLTAEELDGFRPVPEIQVPQAFAYVLADIDTGSEFCNVPPRDSVPVIHSRGRTSLTIAEGIATVTVRPDMLRRNRCFSLAGSRCGDSRVPAVWISKNAPKLGWCWNGAPHTWLGTASARSRFC
jgi:hypothetical protein